MLPAFRLSVAMVRFAVAPGFDPLLEVINDAPLFRVTVPTVSVETALGALDDGSLAVITASFETAYRALYSRTPLGVPIEALNWRVVVSGPVPEISGAPRPTTACDDDEEHATSAISTITLLCRRRCREGTFVYTEPSGPVVTPSSCSTSSQSRTWPFL